MIKEEVVVMYCYVKLGKKKIKTKILTKFKERFKSFRMELNPIKTGLCFVKKKSINTYFFCQHVDIIFTDKEHKILKIYPNMRSEKFILRKRKAYYVYILPANSTTMLKVGETLKVTEH